MRFTTLALLAMLLAAPSWGQEADQQDEAPTGGDSSNDAAGAKTLSGMSILGNEETPKSLVIVPWKSSEMGDEQSMSDSLDDQAKPVDKEVFLRELRFYQIRSNE